MLHLDLVRMSRRGVGMKDDANELIVQLCNRIGMIMEDASVAALRIRRIEPDARAAVVAELEIASTQITAVTAAIRALID